jgi:hypothetical protein
MKNIQARWEIKVIPIDIRVGCFGVDYVVFELFHLFLKKLKYINYLILFLLNNHHLIEKYR